MFRGKNQIADNIFPRLKAFSGISQSRGRDRCAPVRQRVDNAFDQAFYQFSGAHQRQLYLLAQFTSR